MYSNVIIVNNTLFVLKSCWYKILNVLPTKNKLLHGLMEISVNATVEFLLQRVKVVNKEKTAAEDEMIR